MAFTIETEDRKLGLAWHDPALAGKPATHVLIVGVGRFAAPGLQPLNSTPASARALAGWFLDGATGRAAEGFANPARPLGSLAMLLSEQDDGASSIFEGAAVPRAHFANVKAALRAWIERAGTNGDSAAVLAVFSHGQAERRRTAVLFEDYGSDPLDPYAGMTEAEQLIDALSTLVPRDKLVILDCCRMQVDLQLPHQGTFGTALIGGVARTFSGRPQVMMSTQYDGAGYGGKDGRPTLFATALLDALRGCAADNDERTVNTRRLSEITERILGLWQKENEPLQVPDTQESKSFVVTSVPDDDRMTMFLSLDEPHDIRTARISVFEDDATVFQTLGAAGPDPFARVRVRSDRTHRLVATDEHGDPIGEETRKSRPPVAFRKLPPDRPNYSLRSIRAMGVAAASDAKLEVNVPGTGPALVMFSRVRAAGADDDGLPTEILMAPGEGGQAESALPPGVWLMDLRRPGILQTFRHVEVSPGETVKVDIPQPQSPHEWLERAVAAAVVPPGPHRMGFFDHEAPALRINAAAGMRLEPRAHDGRLSLFLAEDDLEERFSQKGSGAPVWIEATGDTWRERAFVPLIGRIGHYAGTWSGTPDPWEVEVLADDRPPRRGAHLASYAVSRQWGPMLAFLGRRNFPEAGAALRAIGTRALREAMEKALNPLAAICAALVATATHQTKALGISEERLRNLCDRFPTLPDGAVILARYRLREGRDAGELLDEALGRGVPVTSLAVDWLAEALAITGHARAAEARDTAMSCDPAKAFTVLQLPPEAP